MIGLFYGTRPEYIKIAPLVEQFKDKGVDYKLFQVQQHSSILEGCDYDFIIPVFTSGNRLNSIITSVLNYNSLPPELQYVLVQGDTTTAMAVAMNAFNNQIPVIHLEAGLRTYDKHNPFPEEVNRRIISALATIHYCPTHFDGQHLINEGYHNDIVTVTGNTVLDSLRDIPVSKCN